MGILERLRQSIFTGSSEPEFSTQEEYQAWKKTQAAGPPSAPGEPPSFTEELQATLDGRIAEQTDGGLTYTLDEIDPAAYGVRLVRGEELYAVAEHVKRIEYKNDGSFTVSALRVAAPIAKGIGFRTYRGKTHRPKRWIGTDTGRLILTSNAIQFDGAKRNVRTTTGQILKFSWGEDGVDIEPRHGAVQRYEFKATPEFIANLLIVLNAMAKS